VAGDGINSFNNDYLLNTGGFTIANPLWLTVDEQNASVGLTVNAAKYQAMLDAATRQKGIANRGAWQLVANQAYSQMRAAQATALNDLRRQQAQAIMNGGAKGISAATQMLLRLGIEQSNTEQMTTLRQAQAQTYLDENAELAANVGAAVEYTDTQRQFIAGIARDRYTVDMNGAMGAASAASTILAAREAAAAARYAADASANAVVQSARIAAAAARP